MDKQLIYSLITFLLFFGTFLILTTNNLIYSILGVIFIYLLIAALIIFVGLDFIGFMLIIVYIGAIAMLFLFVIMLFNIPIISLTKSTNFKEKYCLYVVGALLYQYSYYSCYDPLLPYTIPFGYSNLQVIGLNIYSATFYFYILLIGIFLLVILCGAILITSDNEVYTRLFNTSSRKLK